MPDQTTEKLKKMLRDAGCSLKVIAHCRAVKDCACEYARTNSSVDFSLVQTGAMLHDIGRGHTHSIAHAQQGADLLRAKGFSEHVARIVECHTGAGLSADECSLLGLIPRDCIPTTTEEKIVCHADNLLAGARLMSIEHSISSAFHLPRKVRKRIYQLATEVELLCK
jgi:uncharacterized protein